MRGPLLSQNSNLLRGETAEVLCVRRARCGALPKRKGLKQIEGTNWMNTLAAAAEAFSEDYVMGMIL
jgi:hypothetical protein